MASLLQNPELILFLIGAGIISGFIAGLFGVGVGSTMVPVLYELFTVLDVDPAVKMHLSIGTSFAIMLPTSARSFWGHCQSGCVREDVISLWAKPVIAGVFAGLFISGLISATALKLIFMGLLLLIAFKFILGARRWRFSDTLPANPVLRIYGLAIGFFSTLMGIGGGAFGSMVFTIHGQPIHNAVATSSGLGVLIAIPAMLGFIMMGVSVDHLTPFTLGYVHWMAAFLMIPITTISAVFGVRFAHYFPKRVLEISFGVFLFCVVVRFAATLAYQ